MTITLGLYQERRDALLAEIIASLSNDERFVAGWLTGSLSRNESDSVSDIDLSLVVSDEYSTRLCKRLSQVSVETSPERYALFSQFGTPALIYENNNNALQGGTFTFVLNAKSAVMVDWILIPQSKALRPYQSELLFDREGITISSPPNPESLIQRKQLVTKKWAFFWMMTAITIKYMIRDDGVFVMQWIENLNSLIQEMERLINGKPWNYTRGSLSQLQTTREKQLESLKQLCKKMQDAKPRVAEFTGSEPLLPSDEIAALFSFVNK